MHLDGFEGLHERWAFVPAGAIALGEYVVAVERRDGNATDVADAELGCKQAVLGADGFERLLLEVDQVHFVDGEYHVLDTQQRHQISVTACLGLHPYAGVDQDDRQLRRRGAGHHIAGVLLVSRGVGDNELALVRGEVPECDVDVDALLTFGLQAVDQQGQIDFVALSAERTYFGAGSLQLIFGHQLGVIE